MKKLLISLICLAFISSGCSLNVLFNPQNSAPAQVNNQQGQNQQPGIHDSSTQSVAPNQTAACTQEAKICSDGSTVGRTGPNCEFAPCPEVQGKTVDQQTSASSSLSQTYENQYMKFTLPAGWSVDLKDDSAAVNITKDNYILYINTKAEQVSGVQGGRFDEISVGAPSADAVITFHPSEPCGSSEAVSASVGQKRVDLYVNSKEKREWCVSPANGSTVWYFSYITDSNGGYFNYYKASEPLSLVITMAYNSKDVNKLPVKGSAKLNAMLAEMTNIVKTLEIK